MQRIVAAIVGNPALLAWIALVAFGVGVISGAGGAWYLQGLRLDALQSKYDGFVTATRAEGEAAKKQAETKAAADRQLKESSDREYQATIDSLHADVKRMRDARAGSRFVPAAPAGSRRVDLACFDRAELEQALQRFDDGISGIVEEGDAGAVGLNVARRWASGIGSGKSPDSPASSRP